jgi:hypothetical protein
MFIWTKRGIVGIVAFGVSICIGESLYPRDQGNEYRFIVAFMISGLINWFLGSLWNREKFVYNDATQQYDKVKNNHTLYWIPMQYMGMILLGGAVYVMGKSSILWAILLALGILVLFLLKFYWDNGGFEQFREIKWFSERTPKKSKNWQSRYNK